MVENRIDCSLLVNSCDAYSDVWEIFFKCLKVHWPGIDMPIFLNSESKQYDNSDVQVTTLNYSGKSEWCGRLKDALLKIESEFVLLLLDDFCLNSDVNLENLNKCFFLMQADPTISCIHIPERGVESNTSFSIRLMDNREYGVLGCGPSIWRREDLLFFTREWLSAWLFEAYGSYYARKSKKRIYFIGNNTSDIFKYSGKMGGCIHKNYWVGCVVRPLIEELGIDIDLNERGCIENWQKEGWQEQISLKTKIKNRFILMRTIIS